MSEAIVIVGGHQAGKTAETTKIVQTKIGYRLRQLAERLERTDPENLELAEKARKCRVAGFNVDRAAISMGYKGAQVKNLANYHEAMRVYEFAAGKPYAD